MPYKMDIMVREEECGFKPHQPYYDTHILYMLLDVCKVSSTKWINAIENGYHSKR